MHFHLPKPLHGWREFAGEVGIIVIGVLIALAAEQVVEDVHWQQRVRSTNDELKAEVYQSGLNMAERIALQRCLRGQIERLATQLNRGGEQWKGMPVVLDPGTMIKNGGEGPVLTPAYRRPTRLWIDDQWRAAISQGTLAHFPPTMAQAYAVFYRGTAQLSELQAAEATAASKLAYLATDRTLSPSDRSEMFAALAEVDRINSLMALASAQALQGLSKMQLHFDRRQEMADARDLSTYERGLRGDCFDPLRVNFD
jgi:hypothetical protein